MKQIKILLLTSPGCPHCSDVKSSLEQLQSEGVLLDIDVIDIAEQPLVAERYDVRSVPWLQLGMFELAGAWSVAELRDWYTLATTDAAMREYFAKMLSAGQLTTVERVLRRYPGQVSELLALIVEHERDINVHIGISAVLEGMQGDSLLVENIETLAKLTSDDQARVRADACHYLMLTGDRRAAEYIKLLCNDTEAEVREIASESLESLLEEIS